MDRGWYELLDLAHEAATEIGHTLSMSALSASEQTFPAQWREFLK
jgi:hypothetical protein